MSNVLVMTGELKKLTINEPRNANKNASAVMLIQYGKSRETTNNAVEFVNAALIRVPSYKFPALRDKLKEGQKVSVVGHIQGVWKNSMDHSGFLTAELVADRIEIESEPDLSTEDPPAAE